MLAVNTNCGPLQSEVEQVVAHMNDRGLTQVRQYIKRVTNKATVGI